MHLTARLLSTCIDCPLGRAEKYAPALRLAMERYGIIVPGDKRRTFLRSAHFLSQIAHESQGLVSMEENLNYSAAGLLKTFPKYFRSEAEAQAYARQPQKIANYVYAGRMGNGPESSGDGWRYRGRGAGHLTGLNNYLAYTKHVQEKLGKAGVDFVKTPAMVADLPWSVDSFGWYWDSRSISTWADADDPRMATIRINGGLNGFPDRVKRLARARIVLAAELGIKRIDPLPPEVLP